MNESLQIGIAVFSLAVQIWATLLVRPLKEKTPPRVWTALMWLCFFVLLRRAFSVIEVFGFGANNFGIDWHIVTTIVIGFAVSICMLSTIFAFRQYVAQEKAMQDKLESEAAEKRAQTRQIAAATLALADQLKNRDYRFEDSDAYKLALKFSESK